ncbi:MAG TPA: helix-turn-helix domain-containing protein [Candidatus Coprocola pullicola]|nr:helix-turn-helix domain-containing protein [Candidatus Coprocola pullicola]
MYNLQLIENRIMSIAKEMGLSKNKLLINTNLNKSVFDNMKRGQIPSVDKIHIIADYLDCSVDYLLGRTDNPNSHKS